MSWRELYDEIAAAASRGPAFDLQLPLSAVAAAGYAGDIVSALTGWHTLANRHKTRLARPRWWLCDPSRAHAELDWISAVPLQRGVRETYLWYLAARWMRPRKHGQGLRTNRGVAGVSQNDLLQDDARDAGVATLVELLDYRAAGQSARRHLPLPQR